MHKTYTYPLEKVYRDLWELINPDNDLMLGLGGTTAWDIESTPPAANPTLIDVPQLFIYLPVTKRLGAKRTNKNNKTVVVGHVDPGVMLSKGLQYEVTTVNSLQELRIRDLKQICLEIEVDHNLLPQTTFRTIGLYRFISYEEGVTAGGASYLPEEITGSLFYVENFRPVTVTNNVKQTFRIVVKG